MKTNRLHHAIKAAIFSVLGIIMLSGVYIGANRLVFATAIDREMTLNPINPATQLMLDVDLVPNEYPFPEFVVFYTHNPHSAPLSHNALSYEDAAAIGSRYIWEMFGVDITGMQVDMQSSVFPSSTRTHWNGTVWTPHDSPVQMALFFFSLDANTGERIGIRDYRRDEIEIFGDTVARGNHDRLMEIFSEIAMDYAQRHFNFTRVVSVSFEGMRHLSDYTAYLVCTEGRLFRVIPSDIISPEALRGDGELAFYMLDGIGEPIDGDFTVELMGFPCSAILNGETMLDFSVIDETGRLANLSISMETMRLYELTTQHNDILPGFESQPRPLQQPLPYDHPAWAIMNAASVLIGIRYDAPNYSGHILNNTWSQSELYWFLCAMAMLNHWDRRVDDFIIMSPLEVEEIINFAIGGRHTADILRGFHFNPRYEGSDAYRDGMFRFPIGETWNAADLIFMYAEGDIYKFEYRLISDLFGFSSSGIAWVTVEDSDRNPWGISIREIELFSQGYEFFPESRPRDWITQMPVILQTPEPTFMPYHSPEPGPTPPYDGNQEQTPVTHGPAVWIVPPTFDHGRIWNCSCGRFMSNISRDICPVTGVSDGYGCGGHGTYGPYFVYDPQGQLFGHPSNCSAYHPMLGMHPINEFNEMLNNSLMAENYWWRNPTDGLIAVESVDSSLRRWYDQAEYVPYDEDPVPSVLSTWALAPEAFTGRFALMYNRQFVTDFIFDGVNTHYVNWRRVNDTGLMAVSMGGRWGMINRQGNTVIPFIFENLVIIDQNTAFARYNGRYGIIDIHRTI